MTRYQRLGGAVLAATLATAGLSAVTTGTASAAVFGGVTVNPSTGNDETLFGGSAVTDCPANTESTLWTVEGPGIEPFQGYLGEGTPTGDGPQSFSGGSIANLRTVNAGSFSTVSQYRVVFSCIFGPDATDTYEALLNYTPGAGGSYQIEALPAAARGTATTLTAAPTSVEQGTPVELTADVTPTTGADDPAGSVEFFNGATSLGLDNSLTGDGVGTFTATALPVGTNSITAVYTPAAGFTGSTSAPVSVSVSAVAARPTTAVLTASPVSGGAYQAVTLTCAVDAGTFEANGTATFSDNGVTIGSVPVTAGSPAVLTASSFGPGAHSFVCSFVGTAPYTNSTSEAVAASFDSNGSVPDEQTVTVEIPTGAITITTPYTPANPLALGVAVLDPSDSTYSASAPFEDITVTDTRAGDLGFTASLIAGSFSNGASSFPGSHAGFTGVTAVQVAGNAMQASNVTTTDAVPYSPGLAALTEFARYAPGLPTGSVDLTATFGIDAVPTSVQPGLYTSTVTFTAV